jgi:hypothetical protein
VIPNVLQARMRFEAAPLQFGKTVLAVEMEKVGNRSPKERGRAKGKGPNAPLENATCGTKRLKNRAPTGVGETASANTGRIAVCRTKDLKGGLRNINLSRFFSPLKRGKRLGRS